MIDQTNQKKKVSEFVADKTYSHKLIAVGSGSTVNTYLEMLHSKNPQIKVIGASSNTTRQLQKLDLEEVSLDAVKHQSIPICIDGADLILRDKPWIIIKGHGGALTREKIVWNSVKEVYVLVDESKWDNTITKEIPIEITPEATELLKEKLLSNQEIYAVSQRLDKDEPYITDNGNLILNLTVDPQSDLIELQRWIKMVSGVVETGIFCPPLTDKVTIFSANADEIKVISL